MVYFISNIQFLALTECIGLSKSLQFFKENTQIFYLLKLSCLAHDADLTNQLVNISVDKAEHAELRETWVDVMASYSDGKLYNARLCRFQVKNSSFMKYFMIDIIELEWLLVTSFN